MQTEKPKVTRFINRIWEIIYILTIATKEGRRSEPGIINKCDRIIRGFVGSKKAFWWPSNNVIQYLSDERVLSQEDWDFLVGSLPYMANVWYKGNLVYPEQTYKSLIKKLSKMDKLTGGIPECVKKSKDVGLFRVRVKAIDRRSLHVMCDFNEVFTTSDEAFDARMKILSKYPRRRYHIKWHY